MKSVLSLLPYGFPLTLVRNLSSWNSGVDSVIPSETSSRIWNLPCPNLPSTKVALLTPCPLLKHTSSHSPCLVTLFIILNYLIKSISQCPSLMTLFHSIFNDFFYHHNTFFHTLDHAPMLPVFVLNSGNDVSGECITGLSLQIESYWTKIENSFLWHSRNIIFLYLAYRLSEICQFSKN